MGNLDSRYLCQVIHGTQPIEAFSVYWWDSHEKRFSIYDDMFAEGAQGRKKELVLSSHILPRATASRPTRPRP